MTVAELILKLQALPPDIQKATVVVRADDPQGYEPIDLVGSGPMWHRINPSRYRKPRYTILSQHGERQFIAFIVAALD